MSKRGLFSLSADPIHNGHLDIIRVCAMGCSELIVYVTDNDEKAGSYLFSLSERYEMTKRAIRQSTSIGNIRIIKGSDLLTDVYLREGCDMLFRGVRGGADREYELRQIQYHAMIIPELFGNGGAERNKYTLVNPLDRELSLVSSSLVKAFVVKHLNVSEMVPSFVKEMLEIRLLDQRIVGITGRMGSGKSHIAADIVKRARAQGLPAQTVNMDEMVRKLYAEQTPGAQLVREQMAEVLGDEVFDGRVVDREALKRAIAKAPKETLEYLHNLTEPHVYRLLRAELKGRKGLVLLEWAQLAENGLGPLVNYNVIIVSSPDRDEFLAERDLDPEVRARFEEVQCPASQKFETLKYYADREHHGFVVKVINRKGQEADVYKQVARIRPDWFGQP